MKKMRFVLQGLAIACCACCVCASCASPQQDWNELPQGEKYAIKYVFDGASSAIPDYLWKDNGNYPTQYTESVAVKIHGLRAYRKDDDTVYAFSGWYYDADYQTLVEGNMISATQTGDVTLYAKMTERAPTEEDEVVSFITYKWNDFGTMKEGVDTFPEPMIDGVSFPMEYVEGKGTKLPSLKTWKQGKSTYEFEGWCYDENLKEKVSGNEISKEKTGNVVVYAALAVWVG